MIDAMEQITRPKSLFEMAAPYIRQAISKGQLKLGQRISENDLASSLGISKTPVREALAKLKMEGLVHVFPQKGTFVFTLTEKEVVDICELRYTLESTALAFAFEKKMMKTSILNWILVFTFFFLNIVATSILTMPIDLLQQE